MKIPLHMALRNSDIVGDGMYISLVVDIADLQACIGTFTVLPLVPVHVFRLNAGNPPLPVGTEAAPEKGLTSLSEDRHYTHQWRLDILLLR
jgi:hypothetical protein